MSAPQVVHFGAFSLIPRRRELRLRGEPVTIGARAFDLLAALIGRHGQLANKDDLIAEVWPGRVVDENNLAAQISALRKVLAGDPGLSGCLQTIPGRGYRFIADVVLDGGTEAAHAPSSPPGSWAEALSLVVLPFQAIGNDPDQSAFAQGLSETIATDLSRLSGLRVIASATAATFPPSKTAPHALGRELDVDYVLTGTVQRFLGSVRINIRLIDGRHGQSVWSERFDGDESDPLHLQDRITGRLANAVGREVFVHAARDGEARRIDPRCFDLVMRGIAADNRPQSVDSLKAQEALFTRATAIDPDHAEAHARLARAILLQVTQVHAAEVLDADMLARGVRAAERAVTLDPCNARAHCAMGLLHVLRGDFDRAALSNETAIALDRNYALAYNNLGNSLFHLGDGQDALSAVETALLLDPRGPQVGAFLTTRGFAHLLLGEVAAAAASFARGRSANPKLPRALLGTAVSSALSGDIAAARRATGDLLALIPGYRLSHTMDAIFPGSPPRYRTFHNDVLYPGARQAGVPV